MFQQDIEQKIRFVTGTDCHDWSVYPSETPEKLLTDGFPYTFAKCLPTFKGLVMAITDHTRLKCVNSFFNVDKKTLEEIKFEHSGTAFTIPLSKGINAIIGDNTVDKENTRIETVHKILTSISTRHLKTISDRQKKQSSFTERTADVKSRIVELIRYEHALRVYKPNVETQKILPHSNQILDYEFISKLNIDEISIDYFNSVLSKTLKIGKKINWETITENDLKDMLLRYDDTEVLQFFKSAINEVLNQDFSAKYSIISQGTDKYAEMSSGLDSKIYFDLLCSETHHDGVYLIDQPEDNISQKAIKDYLLDRFKNMGEVRQVIMVTHNPQFIVNLDVDNLIFLSKDESGLKIRSGALEYECPEYNILDIVAQNIDGGLDSIRKRWKRYEKTAVL